MTPQQDVQQYIKTTETFVRWYVLLSQHLDRCHDEGGRSVRPGGHETKKTCIFPIPGLGSCWKGKWLITHLNVEGGQAHGFDN